MRRLVAFSSLVLVAVAGFLIYSFSSPTEAQRNVSTRFEYALINGSYLPYPGETPSTVSGAVNICYLQPAGCVNEEIRTEVILSKFVQDERLENSGRAKGLAQERATQTSFSRAISKLGSEGWEMVEAPAIEFDLYYPNQQNIQTVKEGLKTERQHVWFKRERQ